MSFQQKYFVYLGVLPPVFGVPKGPFGTPGGPVGAEGSLGSAGKKEGSSKRAEYLGKVKALNIQVKSCLIWMLREP